MDFLYFLRFSKKFLDFSIFLLYCEVCIEILIESNFCTYSISFYNGRDV